MRWDSALQMHLDRVWTRFSLQHQRVCRSHKKLFINYTSNTKESVVFDLVGKKKGGGHQREWIKIPVFNKMQSLVGNLSIQTRTAPGISSA